MIVPTMELLQLIDTLGFPIAGAVASGYFVFLTLRFILDGVTSSVRDMLNIIGALGDRVLKMTNDLYRIDVRVTHALKLSPSYNRTARKQ